MPALTARLAVPLALALLAGVSMAENVFSLRSCLCAPGDMNGDGVPDIVVAARDGDHWGELWVLSGKDGSLLRTLHAPLKERGTACSIESAGDLDKDGIPDLVVGSRSNRAWALSGKDGRVLFELVPGCESFTFGACVTGGQDVDGDGIPDLLVGSPGRMADRFEEPATPGAAMLFSGKDGSRLLLLREDGRVPDDMHAPFVPDANGHGKSGIHFGRSLLFGVCVAFGGDLDGDGHPDLLVSSGTTWTASLDIARKTPGFDSNGFQMFSSKDGRLLRAFPIKKRESPGEVLVLGRYPDFDKDGVDDIYATLPDYSVRIISAKSGETLLTSSIQFDDSTVLQGSSAGLTADLDGDGHPEIVIGGNGFGVMGDPGGFEVVTTKQGYSPKNLSRTKQCAIDVQPLGGTEPRVAIAHLWMGALAKPGGRVKVSLVDPKTQSVIWSTIPIPLPDGTSWPAD